MLDGLEGAAAGSLDRADADRTPLGARQARVPAAQRARRAGRSSSRRAGRCRTCAARCRAIRFATLTAARPSAAAGAVAGCRAQPPRCRHRRPPLPRSSKPRLVGAPGRSAGDPAVLRARRTECRGANTRRSSSAAPRVGFSDPKNGIDESRDVLYAAPISDGPVPVDWAGASSPRGVGRRASSDRLPRMPALSRCRRRRSSRRTTPVAEVVRQWLAQTEKLELLRHRDLKLTSKPGESERDFRIRVKDAHRAERDAAVDAVRKKYAAKQAQLDRAAAPRGGRRRPRAGAGVAGKDPDGGVGRRDAPRRVSRTQGVQRPARSDAPRPRRAAWAGA